jgi:hypothetical protein
MRVMLYRDVEAEIAPRQLVDASGVVADSRPLEPPRGARPTDAQ